MRSVSSVQKNTIAPGRVMRNIRQLRCSMSIIICFLIFCGLSGKVHAQTGYKSFYVSIADPNILSYNKSSNHTFTEPYFKDDSLNRVVRPYDVRKFSRSFPSEKDEDMQRVWTIVSDQVDSLYLAEKLLQLYPDIFLFIEEDISGCNCLYRK